MKIDELRIIGSTQTNVVMDAELRRIAQRAVKQRPPNPRKEGLGQLVYPFDRDLAWALTPTRARALALDKAYLAIVREQSFVRGRDALLTPATRVHERITEPGTGLGESGAPEARVHRDGRLHLDWRGR